MATILTCVWRASKLWKNNNDKMVAYHRWDQGGAGDDVIVERNDTERALVYRLQPKTVFSATRRLKPVHQRSLNRIHHYAAPLKNLAT
ncbi:MAG: hypothetical protein Q8M16_13155 [Pirellulaceae bacterium]|nr:hypothetical protein [Pirellulaceae bacterium]